jgi:hypothetical protein
LSRRLVGFIITAAGAVLAYIAAAADLIGISSGGSADMFGKRQIIDTTIGAVMVVAGLVIALLPRRRIADHPTGGASASAATSSAGGVVNVGLAAGTRGRLQAGKRGVPAPGRTWHVSEPGVTVVDSPGGGGVVARLAAGTPVVEVERQGEHLKVTTPDRRTGWVERRSVF